MSFVPAGDGAVDAPNVVAIRVVGAKLSAMSQSGYNCVCKDAVTAMIM